MHQLVISVTQSVTRIRRSLAGVGASWTHRLHRLIPRKRTPDPRCLLRSPSRWARSEMRWWSAASVTTRGYRTHPSCIRLLGPHVGRHARSHVARDRESLG